MADETATISPSVTLSPLFVLRSVVGGVLMGLANLVPGVSGGTMLLAAGVGGMVTLAFTLIVIWPYASMLHELARHYWW